MHKSLHFSWRKIIGCNRYGDISKITEETINWRFILHFLTLDIILQLCFTKRSECIASTEQSIWYDFMRFSKAWRQFALY